MDINQIVLIIFVGLLGGILSGLFGIGGGIILVPALVLILGFDQRMAQGTTLFMLMLPVVAMGVYKYWQMEKVSWQVGLLLALGFVGGAWLGALWANRLPTEWAVSPEFVIRQPLKKLFGILMIFMAVRLLIAK